MDQRRTSTTAGTEISAELRASVDAVLTDLATTQPTAREAFQAIIDLVAATDGDIPSGARLVHLVNLFNSHRPDGVNGIPLGSAGVAQECVSEYRRGLLSLRKNPVSHPSLPADMAAGMNRWLDRLMQSISTRMDAAHQTEIQSLRARHAQDKAEMTTAHANAIEQAEAALQHARHAAAALEERATALENERASLLTINEQLGQRNQELVARLDARSEELRASDQRKAVEVARANALQKERDQLQAKLSETKGMVDDLTQEGKLKDDRIATLRKQLGDERHARSLAETKHAHVLEQNMELRAERTTLLSRLSEPSPGLDAKRTPKVRPLRPAARKVQALGGKKRGVF